MEERYVHKIDDVHFKRIHQQENVIRLNAFLWSNSLEECQVHFGCSLVTTTKNQSDRFFVYKEKKKRVKKKTVYLFIDFWERKKNFIF